MRLVSLVAVLVFATAAWAGGPAPTHLSFDKAKVGEVPKGWKTGVTGKATSDGVWKIEEDKTAPGGSLVLAQTSKSPGTIFVGSRLPSLVHGLSAGPVESADI